MLTKSQKIWLAAAMFMGLVLRPGGVVSKPDNFEIGLEIGDLFDPWVGAPVIENRPGSNLPISAQDLDAAIHR